MSEEREQLVVPKDFFTEQVKMVSGAAKDAVEAKRKHYLDNTNNFKKAIDTLAASISRTIRRIIKSKGVTYKKQLETLCTAVRDEISRDKGVKHYNDPDINSIIEDGLNNAAAELQRKFGNILEQLPENDPTNQREGFFEELAECGVEEEDALESIMAKLNSILFGFSSEFFERIKQFDFQTQLSVQQIGEFKSLFKTVSGEIRRNIASHVERNPQLSFELLKENILEVLEGIYFNISALPQEVVEIFESAIIHEFIQYVGAASSIQDLWDLTNDTMKNSITSEEIQSKLMQNKLLYLEKPEEEKEPYPISDKEGSFILRLYLSMDKGGKAQTHQERIQEIAARSNDENHGGLAIRTAKDVDELLNSIPPYGSKDPENGKTSPAEELMQAINSRDIAPRKIGQALLLLRESLAQEVVTFHTLRVPDEEINRLSQQITEIATEIETIAPDFTESVATMNEHYGYVSALSELAILRAEKQKDVPLRELNSQLFLFEQFLQVLEKTKKELERIQVLLREIEQIQASLQSIYRNIEEGETYINSTLPTKTFGADPRAILGDEYSYIFDYVPNEAIDLEIEEINAAIDTSLSKITELKQIDLSKIFDLTDQTKSALSIVKAQLGDDFVEE